MERERMQACSVEWACLWMYARMQNRSMHPCMQMHTCMHAGGMDASKPKDVGIPLLQMYACSMKVCTGEVWMYECLSMHARGVDVCMQYERMGAYIIDVWRARYCTRNVYTRMYPCK